MTEGNPTPDSAPATLAHVFDNVEAAIQDIAQGRMVIVTDDEDRENEGDLVMAGAKATPEAVNTMIKYGSGIICVPMMADQLNRLGIHQMVAENREVHRTDFSVSVDAAEGITTGISAYDRWRTIAILADLNAKPKDLVQPGHVFPLRAKPGGVLRRAGHTEATVDLALLAGLPPIGVLCELMNDDGTVARTPELIEYKKRLGLKMISIASLIEYRHRRDRLIEKVGEQPFPSRYGEFTLHVFRSILDDRQHYVLSMGDLGPEPALVRVHRENLLGDIFGSRDMETSRALEASLERIAAEGRGVLLYIAQPYGGIDFRKLDPEHPMKRPRMDFRDYGIGAQILVHLGLSKIRVLSTTSRNVIGLDGFNLEIVEQIQIP